MEQKSTSTNPVYSNTKISVDQALLFRQEDFPRKCIFRIYPPASNKSKNPQSHNFNIASIPLKDGLMISNLPLVERAHLQKYNIKCNAKNYSVMLDAPKYIFDAYHFNFQSCGKTYSKTHYFAIAPTLADVSEKTMVHMPILYRMSVCRELGNPEHFSFNLYAIAGGYADGFYFMSRLDNHVPEFAHLSKISKSNKKVQAHHSGANSPKETIDFPHIHRPNFEHYCSSLCEFSAPVHVPELKNCDFYECLSGYLKMHNIQPQMLLIQQDMSIEHLTQLARTFHLQRSLQDFATEDLAKISMSNFGQYEIYTEHKQKEESLPMQECDDTYLRP